MSPAVADHVVLTARDYPGGPCDTLSFVDRALFRVLPDGVTEAQPFEIPVGRVLVVTDVDWSAYGGPRETNPLEAGCSLRLTIEVGTATQMAAVFESSMTIDAAAARGRPGLNVHLTSGFLAAAGTRLCPHVAQVQPSGTAVACVDTLILRGYLRPR